MKSMPAKNLPVVPTQLPPGALLRLVLRQRWRFFLFKWRKWWCSERDARRIAERVSDDWHTGIAPLELGATLTSFGSGFWMGFPYYHYFVGNSPVYEAMCKVLPGDQWGVIFYLMAAWLAVAYILGHRGLRRVGASFNLFLWFGISALLFKEAPAGWITVLCWIIVFYELVRATRLRERRTQCRITQL